jgi:hypothetical protein
MVPYLVITQAVSVVGLVHGIWVYGFANLWATAAFAALGAYILWPVAWLGVRQGLRTRREAREARTGRHRSPAPSGVDAPQDTVSVADPRAGTDVTTALLRTRRASRAQNAKPRRRFGRERLAQAPASKAPRR